MGVAMQLGGLTLEILGVMLMAQRYLEVNVNPVRELVPLLAHGLFRTSRAKGAADLADINPERSVVHLQGLALLFFGFLTQAAGVIVATVSGTNAG